ASECRACRPHSAAARGAYPRVHFPSRLGEMVTLRFPLPVRGEGQGEGRCGPERFPLPVRGEGQGEGRCGPECFPLPVRGEGQGEGRSGFCCSPLPVRGEG